MLSVLDQRQFELVKFQLGDLAQSRLQRLPRKTQRAAGDEHPTLLTPAHPRAKKTDSMRGRAPPPHLVLFSARSYRSLRSDGRGEAASVGRDVPVTGGAA